MKKSFLTALFALSIATSIPVAKVEAMDLNIINNFKEATKELIRNKNILNLFLKTNLLCSLYGLANPGINLREKKYILFAIKQSFLIAAILNAKNLDVAIKNHDKKKYLILIDLILLISTAKTMFILINRYDYIRENIDNAIQQKINQLILWYKFKKLLSPKLITQPCSICIEDNTSTYTSGSTSCNHTFHKSCLKTWLEKNLTCPICRTNL